MRWGSFISSLLLELGEQQGKRKRAGRVCVCGMRGVQPTLDLGGGSWVLGRGRETASCGVQRCVWWLRAVCTARLRGSVMRDARADAEGLSTGRPRDSSALQQRCNTEEVRRACAKACGLLPACASASQVQRTAYGAYRFSNTGHKQSEQQLRSPSPHGVRCWLAVLYRPAYMQVSSPGVVVLCTRATGSTPVQ